MRIRTSGNYEYRLGLYDDVGTLLDENTRSGAIDGACEFTQQMLPALAKAVEHSNMTEERSFRPRPSTSSTVSRPAFTSGKAVSAVVIATTLPRFCLTIYGDRAEKYSMAAANTPSDSDSESLNTARTELRDAVPEAAETMRELLDPRTNGYGFARPRRSLIGRGSRKRRRVASPSRSETSAARTTVGVPSSQNGRGVLRSERLRDDADRRGVPVARHQLDAPTGVFRRRDRSSGRKATNR